MMTIGELLSVTDENTNITIINNGKEIANYDGRNSIPIWCNMMIINGVKLRSDTIVVHTKEIV